MLKKKNKKNNSDEDLNDEEGSMFRGINSIPTVNFFINNL